MRLRQPQIQTLERLQRRKSAASFSTVIVTHIKRAPSPPQALPGATKKLWRDIAPVEYFRTSYLSLLAAYFTAVDRKTQEDLSY